MRHVIVDTLDEADLHTLAQALHDSPLLAGGSGSAARWPPAGAQQTITATGLSAPAQSGGVLR
jgi:uncharacterized protein YgbK (DUF1537 family)